ncbi:MAG: hypothetical protein G3M70_12220 [Candidatus Nitronauta litoralis]|uniref:Uncharacterized protein n=1 Tax=Candidatus Nitronauta litoralis TaxID=2705533 RepID=A0A7T0G0R8_9BACT|nr:MAG: hypothetical protein G3M70_12220 [Candidatus Nitronauta litoralis]
MKHLSQIIFLLTLIFIHHISTALAGPPNKPYGPDILGIRLGMSMEEAEAIVRKNINVTWVFERNLNDLVKKKSDLVLAKPYLTLKSFVSQDQKEGISLYSAPPATNKLVAVARFVPLGKNDTQESIITALKGKYGPLHPMLAQPHAPVWSKVKGMKSHCKGSPSFRGTNTFIPIKLVETPKGFNNQNERDQRRKRPKAIPEIIASFWNDQTMPDCSPVLGAFFHGNNVLFGLVDHGPYSVYYQKNLKAVKQKVNSQPLPPPSFKF